jgi:hypothetical protein
MKHVRTNVVTLLAGVQLMQSSIASRALTGEKFASIAGKARDVRYDAVLLS